MYALHTVTELQIAKDYSYLHFSPTGRLAYQVGEISSIDSNGIEQDEFENAAHKVVRVPSNQLHMLKYLIAKNMWGPYELVSKMNDLGLGGGYKKWPSIFIEESSCNRPKSNDILILFTEKTRATQLIAKVNVIPISISLEDIRALARSKQTSVEHIVKEAITSMMEIEQYLTVDDHDELR